MIFVIVIIVSCSVSKSRHEEKIRQAEDLMQSKTDSALSILEAIDPLEIEEDSLKAKLIYLKAYGHMKANRIEALQKMVDEYKATPATDASAVRGIMLKQLGIIKMVAETPTEQNREMLRRISAIDGETNGELVDWGKVFEMIDSLYSGFYSKLHRQYEGQLTSKEEQIIVLMLAGFSTKEISVITGQTTSTIYVRKSSIRKKLGVPEKEDIVEFLNNRDKD